MFDIFSQSLEMRMQFHESAVCWDRGKVAELSKCVLLLSCFYVLRVEDTDEARKASESAFDAVDSIENRLQSPSQGQGL